MPTNNDWTGTFVPAVMALLNGGDPYRYMYNPPWVLAPLIPFALLPYGQWLLLFVAVAAFGVTAWLLKAKPLSVAAYLLSPFVYFALVWGNVEWLVALGFVVAPPIGLLLLAIKPQASLFALVLVTASLIRKRHWKSLILPGGVFLGSVAIFGRWWEYSLLYLTYQSDYVNMSRWLFPYSLLALGGIALWWRKRLASKRNPLRFLSPLAFPVTTQTTWSLPLLAFVHKTAWSVTASAVSWVIVLWLGGHLP